MDTAEKRKLRDDDEEVDDGKKAAKREDISGGGESAGASQQQEEEEVEEFFAILKRMHVAVKYFQKANNGAAGSKPRMVNNEWKPSFLLQDFQGDNEVKDEEKPEDLGEDSGLDLNQEPVSKEKLNETTD